MRRPPRATRTATLFPSPPLFRSLVPALLATVGIYGLVADPADVGRHVTDLLGAAPGEVRDLAESQLSSITSEASQSVSIGLAIALAVALWSASSGMKHLMDALNACYDEVEGRGFFKVRGIALLLTVDRKSTRLNSSH